MIITTHKQFPNYKRYEIEYEGRPLVMETGKLAELCNSAVLVSYGETTVLVTCTASARPKDGVDYPRRPLILTKSYAVGRIPGAASCAPRGQAQPARRACQPPDRPPDAPALPERPAQRRHHRCEVLSVDRDCSPRSPP